MTMRGDKRPARNVGLTDDEIVAHALENGWEQIIDGPAFYSERWTGWKHESGGGAHGIPVTLDGPKLMREWDDAGRCMVETLVPLGWADVMRSRLDHNERCGECGSWIEYNHSHTSPVLREGPWTHCSSCRFWLERVEMIGGGAVRGYSSGRPGSVPFVAESTLGSAYGNGPRPTFLSIGPAKRPSSHNGFGGSWFVVTFPDGREIETCDLWCGGGVPDRFRDRLPITATLRYGRLVTP